MDKTNVSLPEFNSGLEEAVLHSILSTVPDAMIVIDASGRILSFSSAAERMFQYAEAEVLGEDISMLMPSPDRERHGSYISHYLDTGERKVIGIGRLTNARRRDGSIFPIDLSVGEAYGAEKRVFTGFIRDLTETRKRERRLQDLQHELAHMSRITAMGTLASALAHELNQPLTAIANYMEASADLVDSTDPQDRDMLREAISEAAGQALRAGEIIRSLREFIQRGETDRQSESLRILLNEGAALAFAGIDSSGIDFDLTVPPDADHVLTSRVQLQQVIINLVRNAVEAMRESQGRRLRISSMRDADGKIRISVEDNGPGLSPDIEARLFTPFNTSKAKGMGVGLSICQTIVEGQGGRIWANHSALGGAAFHFTLDPCEEAGND
ncbi:MAG: PAS domain S-box protein [Alphaproteobacteria bacterium]|nr:PAS domain S-box protein [Alphaproteobacteria bacterium]